MRRARGRRTADDDDTGPIAVGPTADDVPPDPGPPNPGPPNPGPPDPGPPDLVERAPVERAPVEGVPAEVVEVEVVEPRSAAVWQDLEQRTGRRQRNRLFIGLAAAVVLAVLALVIASRGDDDETVAAREPSDVAVETGERPDRSSTTTTTTQVTTTVTSTTLPVISVPLPPPPTALPPLPPLPVVERPVPSFTPVPAVPPAPAPAVPLPAPVPSGTVLSTTTTTSPAPPGRPGVAVAASGRRLVALDTRTGASLRVLDERPSGGETAGLVAGVSVSADGQLAYYGVLGAGCGDDRIFRVPVAGGAPQEVATGRSPSLSPDGRLLAYARQADPPSASCSDEVVVRDLGSGAERRIGPPPGPRLAVQLSMLAWSGDNRSLAVTDSFEGRSVVVLDTTTAVTLADGRTFDPDGAYPGCAGSAAFGVDGRLVAIGTHGAFCPGDPAATGADLLTGDPGGPATVVRRLPPSALTLATDRTGDHLLVVGSADGTITMLGDDEAGDRVLGTGFTDADW